MADRVWRRLRALANSGTLLRLQWVPGHAGLPGNELADEVARAAADLDQGEAPIDLSSAKARLKRHAFHEWEQHIRPTRYFEENGPRRVVPGERLGLSRHERQWRWRVRAAAQPACAWLHAPSRTSALYQATTTPRPAQSAISTTRPPTVKEALEDPHRLVDYLASS